MTITYVLTNQADTFYSSENYGRYDLYALDGNDYIHGDQYTLNIYGGRGKDYIYVNGEVGTTAYGNQGNDILEAVGAGPSWLHGGRDNDVLRFYGPYDAEGWGGTGVDRFNINFYDTDYPWGDNVTIHDMQKGEKLYINADGVFHPLDYYNPTVEGNDVTFHIGPAATVVVENAADFLL